MFHAMKRLIVAGMALVPLVYAVSAQAQYKLPFKAEDLDAGEYLFTRDHAAGIQAEGHDITSAKRGSGSNWERSNADSNAGAYIYNQPFYAVAAGEVLACWRNAPENPKPGETHPKKAEGWIAGGGNHLWVQQDDGVVALYAHAKPGTIPSSLCPHNAELLPQKAGNTGKSPDILPFIELAAGKRPRVTAGQLLGRVGNSGASSGPHLHLHFEKGGKPVAPKYERGLYTAWAGGKPNVSSWTSLAAKSFPSGEILFWPPRSLSSEYARHGLPASDYQPLFDHLVDSGFAPTWLDGYDVSGKSYFNLVFRPSPGGSWAAYHGLNGADYQKRFDENNKAGRKLQLLDSYLSDGNVRYIAMFSNKATSSLAYHGISQADHQQRFDDAFAQGYRPVSVSVVAVNNERKYSAFYVKSSTSLVLRSALTPAQYQTEVTQNDKAGLKLAYLNSYVLKGEPYIIAIWRSDVGNAAWKARHGLTASQYQAEWSSATSSGMSTRAVTAYASGNTPNFAALWRK